MSSLSDTSSACSARLKCKTVKRTSSAPDDAITITPAGTLALAGTSNSSSHSKRRKLLPPDPTVSPPAISSDGSRACCKRRQSSKNLSVTESNIANTNGKANVANTDGISLGIGDDFPTQFHLPSRRNVRRRVSAPDTGSNLASETTPTPSTAHRPGHTKSFTIWVAY